MGGVSACTSVSEFAEAPPTPDPSPPLRGGRGEESGMTDDHPSIAATASISISQPGRIRRLTTTNVLAGGFSTLI